MPPFALYIHWPFCASKCPYCDFNSLPRPQEAAEPWGEALRRELEAVAVRHAAALEGRCVDSVFFGGGTPSRMPPALVATLLATVARLWPVADDAEITLEANPATADVAALAAFRAAGVTRLSLGAQALDDAALRRLGRLHDRAGVQEALAAARRCFPQVSCDLITGRPGQSLDGWSAELAEVLRFAPDHLSVYALTLEPGTPFYRQAERGQLALPDEGTLLALDAVTAAAAAAAGLANYEISNYARPGRECRHNRRVWRSGDYLGVGPGAHGRLWQGWRRLALENQSAPDLWRAQVEACGHGGLKPAALSSEEAFTEVLLMGLRLVEGACWETLAQALAGGDPRARLAAGCARLEGLGLLETTPRHIRATARGRQCLNSVLATLLFGGQSPPVKGVPRA